MSSVSLYINNTLIPDEDVVKYPKSTEKLSEDGKVLPDTLEITLDNIDKRKYDDRYEGSFFYGTDWYGDKILLYDNELQTIIFEGIQTNLEADDSNGTLQIEASNYFAYLKDKRCIYDNSGNKTIAQIIYELLTDENNGNLPKETIVYSSFQSVINIQDANSVYYNVNFDEEKSKEILNVINELLRISQCALHSKKNLIYLYQWDEYDGEIGNELPKRHVVTKTFKQYFDDTNIYNSASIVYDNAGSREYKTFSDSESIARFGERIFKVPEETVDSTSTSDYNIICKNAAGAAYLAELAVKRYKDQKKLFSVTISDALSFLEIADQIDLNFSPFVREPAAIIEREYDREKKQLKIKGEFRNLPANLYARDMEAPPAPELVSVVSSDSGTVQLTWTKSSASDWLGYKIYFTSTKGMWWQEMCNHGKSPLDKKITEVTPLGHVSLELLQLNPGTTYYFKVSAYDTSYNESICSDTKSCVA